MREIKKMLVYLKGYALYYPVAIIFMITLAASQNSFAVIVKYFVDFVNNGFASQNDLFLIAKLGAIAALITFFSKFGQDYTLNFLAENLLVNMRNDILEKIVYLPMSFFKKSSKGDLISRMTNDLSIVQNFMKRGIPDIVMHGASLIVAIYLMIKYNLHLFLIIFAVAPVIVIILYFLGNFVRKYTIITQKFMGKTISVLQEIISGMEVIKLFTTEPKEVKKYKKVNNDYLQKQLKVIRVTTIQIPFIELLGATALVLIFYFGGKFILNKTMTTGDFMAFFVAAGNASNSIRRITGLHLMIQRTSGAASRIFEVSEVKNPILENNGDIEKDKIEGNVVFDKVFFGYGEKDILKNISFEAKKGEIVALVGSSGAGKTSLVSLIPRLYDVTDGAIYIDGVDIRKFKVENLRKHISFVSQTNFLFSGSIYENIAYGVENCPYEKVIEAAKAAYAHDFIMSFEKGYDTEIGELGSRLSGGERQRLAIARAILKNPEILVLDEATSSLDTESEHYVQNAINNLIKNRTVFVVAHRLSTIKNANKIIVLNKGEISSIDTHENLLKHNEIYKKLYSIQFKV